MNAPALGVTANMKHHVPRSGPPPNPRFPEAAPARRRLGHAGLEASPLRGQNFFSFYNAEIALLLITDWLSSSPVTSHTEAHDIPAYGNGDGGTATIAEATTVGEVRKWQSSRGGWRQLPAAQERR